MTSTTKTQTGRRQVAPGKLPVAATGAQTSNTIMDLLLDLSSHMPATEELLAMHTKTELKYPPARSIHDDMGDVQPDWQPNIVYIAFYCISHK